jgi:hypothetical protein
MLNVVIQRQPIFLFSADYGFLALAALHAEYSAENNNIFARNPKATEMAHETNSTSGHVDMTGILKKSII